MGTVSERLHGCACGRPGELVASRPIGNNPSLHREVDVLHEDSQKVHTNIVKFGEPMTLQDGTRWVAP